MAPSARTCQTMNHSMQHAPNVRHSQVPTAHCENECLGGRARLNAHWVARGKRLRWFFSPALRIFDRKGKQSKTSHQDMHTAIREGLSVIRCFAFPIFLHLDVQKFQKFGHLNLQTLSKKTCGRAASGVRAGAHAKGHAVGASNVTLMTRAQLLPC